MSRDWRAWAVCRGTDPEAAFVAPTTPESAEFVQKCCANCPVLGECLTLALRAERNLSSGSGRWGVFGGLTGAERARYAAWGTRPCVGCGEPFIPRNAAAARCRGCVKPRPRVLAEQVEHGTRAGYEQHLRRRSRACDPCRAAKAAYDAGRRSRAGAA